MPLLFPCWHMWPDCLQRARFSEFHLFLYTVGVSPCMGV